MLNLKQKQNNEPLSLEHLSSIQSKIKPKKIQEPSSKSHKFLVKDTTVIPLKRKNHLPSKSAIENVEHIHYNSPNFQLPNNDSHSNHNFTFTHILQQHHNKKQKSNIATRSEQPTHLRLLHSYNQLYKNSDKSAKNKENCTGLAFSQGVSQGLAANEQEFSDMLHSKLSAINLNDQKQSQLSIEKENRKSPYRVVNTNKLNNTPKIKEKNKHRVKQAEKAQNKTFTALIHYNLPAPQRFQNNQINLQCSEKIQKLMKYQPEQICQKIKFQQKFHDGRNKSNLLSTGLINMSNPSQLTNETRPKLSKQTISRLAVESIISQQKVKSFSENSSQKKFDLSQKISETRQKIQQLSIKISKKNEQEEYQTFLGAIEANFNPEMLGKDCLSQVFELQKIKYKIETTIQDLICKLKQLKAKLCSDVEQQIILLKTSVQAKINWLAVSNTLDEKDEANMLLLKTELFIHRIKTIEEEVQKNCWNNNFLKENHVRLFGQLSDIQQSINQISQHFLVKGKQLVNLKKSSSPKIQGLRERIQVFWSKIEKLDQIWQILL